MDKVEEDEAQEIEAGLRRSLEHVAAPSGFTEGVMLRIAERDAARHVGGQRTLRRFSLTHSRTAWWTAAAAAIALAVGGGDILHVRQQRQAREVANAGAQVDLAMQLTSHALNQVETGLERSPVGRFTQFLSDVQR